MAMNKGRAQTTASPRFKLYPKYKDSGVEWLGEVPGHWKIRKTTWLFAIGSGTTPPSEDLAYYGGDIPWVTTSELRESVVVTTEKSVTKEALRDLPSLRLHPKGSVAVAMYGATIGRLGILGTDATVNQACCVFSMPKGIDAAFWFFWLQMRRPYLISLGYGGGQPNLSQELLRSVRVPTPPEEEQRAIVAFLDRETAKIDALVAKKERLIELLQEKRTVFITGAVTKGLDPTVRMKYSGVEWLGEIPAHWGTSFMDKLVDPLRRITYGIVQPGEPDPDGIFMVRGQNYSRGWSSSEDVFRVSRDIEAPYKRARLKQGDIVMTIVGAGTGNIAIVPDWLEGANLTQTTARIALDPRKANNRYFSYQLQSVVGTVSVELTVKGAAQPGLNLGHIAKYRVVLPPIQEQKAIADFLDRETSTFDALTERVLGAIDRLKELRTALISGAVTGKIDVRGEVV